MDVLIKEKPHTCTTPVLYRLEILKNFQNHLALSTNKFYLNSDIIMFWFVFLQ